ncbi:MAG TPA: ABC transporter substrate-binding protein [Trueperaceae bacterium]
MRPWTRDPGATSAQTHDLATPEPLKPTTLDPVRAFDTSSVRVVENVYGTLYGYGSGSTELVPRLATAYDVSPDGLVRTFTLREGVEFHSGNRHSCADVEWSFENAFVVATPGVGANYLPGWQVMLGVEAASVARGGV